MQTAIDQLIEFQEILLDSNHLYMADEIIEQVCQLLPADSRVLFYMRERRRFTDVEAAKDPYLRFPYLSFEYQAGDIRRFQNPSQLTEREAEVQAEGFLAEERDVAIVRWQAHKDIDAQLVAHIRRVFLIFYHVCGPREHFIEGISRRFVREFIRDQGRDFSNYKRNFDEIRSKLGIDVALGFEREPIPERASATLQTLIDLAPGSSHAIDIISDKPDFIRDLHSSISRKSRNFGRVRDTNTYYCINTLTEDHFVPGLDEKTEYRLARRAVLIFLKQQKRLSLDAIHNASKLIASGLREQAFIHREDPFFKVLQQCQQAEEALGASPRETRDAVEDVIRKLLNPFLKETATPASMAERIAVRRYDTFGRTLRLLAGTNLNT
jgi:hypothetical protein